MSGCSEWQERMALATGGDLSEADRITLDRHLAGCPACAEELEAIQRSMALVREAHEEPIAEAHFTAVRARVLAQIDVRRRRRWASAVALAMAAAAALVVAVWLRPAPVPTPPLIAVVAPPPPVAAPLVSPKRSQPRTRRAAVTVRKPAPVAAEPVVVKLLTDDPNVVIYWIGDGQ